METTYINYIFSKGQLSRRQIKRFCKINNESVVINSIKVVSSELKLSKWYLYTVETSNIPLTQIIKPHHFKDTIVVCYSDITWIISINIPKNNIWIPTIIEEDFMWDFDLNYDTNENSIEFIEILEFTEEDIESFIGYNNKYNKEG